MWSSLEGPRALFCRAVVCLLEVPEKKRVPELERLRLGPMRVSGKAMELWHKFDKATSKRNRCYRQPLYRRPVFGARCPHPERARR